MAPERDPGDVPTIGGFDAHEALKDPTEIGPYHLVRVLGQGGMGTVYLADQAEPIRRQVALKVVKAGMDSREVIGRFESERQALALMNHPHIARVLDAGATPHGRPYFVMELVDGLPFVTYCDTHSLVVRDRIKLFTKVCGAIHHAHQKGIIHRDLKPTNILVATVDGVQVPKVIDFGIAKAIQARADGATAFTELGSAVGTPEYMSPEQAQGALDIDTQSDIYTLGVILYEALVGALPIDPPSLRRVGATDRLRILTQSLAPLPSTRVRQLGADAQAVASRRGTDPKGLARELRGDLDWVVLKAMEKDRARRYASASELAADLDRFLNQEPVVARPPSLAYRLRKLVARHQAAAVAASVASLALLLGAAGTVVELVRARRAESVARAETALAGREAAKAKAVNDFLKDLLTAPDTREQGRNVKVVDALAHASDRLDSSHTFTPEVEAAVREALGTTYTNLGDYKAAEKQLNLSLDLRKRAFGDENPDTLSSLGSLVALDFAEGRTPEGLALARKTLELRKKVLGPDHFDTTVSMNDLATLLADDGKVEEAEAVLRDAAAIRERTLGPEDRRTLVTRSNRGAALARLGKLKDAEAVLVPVLDAQRRVVGPHHSNTLFTLQTLAGVYQDEGKLEEAERAYREALDASTEVSGPEHVDTVLIGNDLGSLLEDRGRFAEAEARFRTAYELGLKTLPANHPFTATFARNLGKVLRKEGKYPESEAKLREAETRYEALHSDEGRSQVQKCRKELATLYRAWGKKDKAAALAAPPS
jgi:non-specific serine/threonine protein kinase/serine/threonine-protein kinase